MWHLSLLVSISLNLRRLALRLGWLKKEEEEEINLRKKKKKRRSVTWPWHAISDFCLFVFVSFFCFFLCQSLTFFLSLNLNPSSSLFWFMGSILHGFDFSWVRFIGSWVRFMGSCNLSNFDSWFHGFDYLLRKSIKEKKILIILIFLASFHLLFCKTWRTVIGSLALFWVCICSGFAIVLDLFLILCFISWFSRFDGD